MDDSCTLGPGGPDFCGPKPWALTAQYTRYTSGVQRTSDFSSAIDRGAAPRSKSDEKSEVLVGVVEIMLAVNYSHSGEVLRLLGTSPRMLDALRAWR